MSTASMRARSSYVLALGVMNALCAAGCEGEVAAPVPTPASDASMPMRPDAEDLDGSEGGAIVDRISVPVAPRDAAITEPTPILDLPIVVMRPHAPKSRAVIDVRVLDTEGAPQAGVAVTAGGAAALTNRHGIARVTEVYGQAHADVFALSQGHTLGHARVALREDATLAAPIVIAAMRGLRTEMFAELQDGGLPEPGREEPLRMRPALESATLERPWGGTATGPFFVHYALLHEPAHAAALPAGMRARTITGSSELLEGALAFELRVREGVTDLELADALEVEIDWPAGLQSRAPFDPAVHRLYHFDERAGIYAARGALEAGAAEQTVRATIDRLGHWLIGQPATALGCARIEATYEGEPLPHGQVLLRSQLSLSASRTELDEAGQGCAQLGSVTTQQFAHALVGGQTGGRAGGHYAHATGSPSVAPQAMSCDDSCTQTSLATTLLAMSCARGRVTLPTARAASITVTVVEGERSYNQVVQRDAELCLEVLQGAQLTFNATGLTCGDEPITVGSGDRFCADGACFDFGTVTCCAAREDCSVVGDDDCDGRVDEGCTCGGTDCPRNTTSYEGCCTAQDVCGLTSPFTEQCVGMSSTLFVPNTMCPSATVPAPFGDSQTAIGCCTMNGECGLLWDGMRCVLPSELATVWGAEVTPPLSMSCVGFLGP